MEEKMEATILQRYTGVILQFPKIRGPQYNPNLL